MPSVPPAAVYYVPSLPGLPADAHEPFDTYAGYLPARADGADGKPADNAHLYFVLHRAMRRSANRRLVVWFNGGPGCSSFDGLMMEVGPWRFQNNSTTLVWTERGGSLNEYVDVLYVDQPVGTGFSYVSNNAYTRTLTQAAREVVFFLERLVEVFPEYARSVHEAKGTGTGVDVYLAGESYAGQYIPFIAHELAKNPSAPVRLAGIAIGNGYIDPATQSGSELDMMISERGWGRNGDNANKVKSRIDECHKALQKRPGPLLEYRECDGIVQQILELTERESPKHCVNIYDIRLNATAPECGMNWPETIEPMYTYLRRNDVRAALHVDEKYHPEAWVECRSTVGSVIHASADSTNASVTLLPSLIESGVPVLVFAGDKDLLCNHIGLERMASQLTWRGARGFDTQAQEYTVAGAHAGTWRASRGLSYVRVADASHMVGFDKPVVMHDLMLRFMNVSVDAPFTGPKRIDSVVGNDTRTIVAGLPKKPVPQTRPVSDAQPVLPVRSPQSSYLWFLILVIGAAVFVLWYRWKKRQAPTLESPHPRTREYAPVDLEERGEDNELSQFRIEDD